MFDISIGWDLAGRAVVSLAPVFVAALSYLSMKGAELLHAKVKNEALAGVLVRLDDAVFTAVCEVQQVVVDKLKAESADGHLDAADRQRVKDAAVDALREYLGPKGLAQVGRVLGVASLDLDRHLEARVEAAVYELRATKAPVLNGHNAPPLVPAS